MKKSKIDLNNLRDELVAVLEMVQVKSRDRKQLTNAEHKRLWNMLQRLKQA